MLALTIRSYMGGTVRSRCRLKESWPRVMATPPPEQKGFWRPGRGRHHVQHCSSTGMFVIVQAPTCIRECAS